MVDSTTQDITKISKNIIQDFSERYSFEQGGDFVWSYKEKMIQFKGIRNIEDLYLLLHEIGHAEMSHESFEKDLHLVQMESEAWQAAKTIAKKYSLAIDNNFIDDHLDTYREWLHKKSLCPNCSQNGLETQTSTYQCLNCGCLWRTNDARKCGLRKFLVVS